VQKLKERYLLLVFILITFSAGKLAVDNRLAHGRIAARKIDVSLFPRLLGKWNSVVFQVDRSVNAILETDDVLIREYRDPAGAAVGLALVYYSDGEKVALHLPESCLLGHGTRLADRTTEKLTLSGSGDFSAVKLITESERGKDIVIYYFHTAGYHTGSYFDFRRKMLLNRISGKPGGGALVRFTVSVTPGTPEEKSIALLHEFIAQAATAIDDFLP
jgi:EpsI family protein